MLLSPSGRFLWDFHLIYQGFDPLRCQNLVIYLKTAGAILLWAKIIT